ERCDVGTVPDYRLSANYRRRQEVTGLLVANRLAGRTSSPPPGRDLCTPRRAAAAGWPGGAEWGSDGGPDPPAGACAARYTLRAVSPRPGLRQSPVVAPVMRKPSARSAGQRTPCAKRRP